MKKSLNTQMYTGTNMRAALNFLILLIYFFPMTSQAESKIPLVDFAHIPDVSMMRISPSGNRIAYRLNKQGVDVLVVQSLDGKKVFGSVDVKKISPTNLYFVSNDKIILTVSDHKKISGYVGEYKISSAFVYDFSKNNFQQLLRNGYGIHPGQTDLGVVVGISEDSKYAFMPAYVEKNSRTKYALTKVSLDKRSKPKVIDAGQKDVIDYFVGDDGRVIARERYNNSLNIHSVESYTGSEKKEVFREETSIPNRGFSGLTPDGSSLVSFSYDEGNAKYYSMSLESGEISDPLFEKEGVDVDHLIVDINRRVYGVQFTGFKPSYSFFDKKINKIINLVQKEVPENSVSIVDYTPDLKSIIFYMEGNSSSGDYFIYNKNTFNFVAAARPEILSDQIHPVDEYYFDARDGLIIPTLVTTPRNLVDKKNLPAVMLPHGGPESHDTKGYYWLAQFLAEKGFVVMQPQFRGSDGFGTQHIIAGSGEWGGKMQDDLTDAVKSLSETGKIDPDNVCIMGMSYGGYAALAGATFTPDVYKCAISINGVSNLEKMLRDEKKDHGKKHWVVSYWTEIMQSDHTDPDILEKISPIYSIKNVKIPVLLIHGDRDKVVPLHQSKTMYKKLKKAKKDVDFIVLKNEGHNLESNESRIKLLESIDAFLDKNLL